MVHISVREWQIASVTACVAVAAGATYWYLHRKQPTEDELEYDRRQTIFNFGRIVDGMLLDGYPVTAPDGTTREMLLYGYEISGVRYECSQDITALIHQLDPEKVKLGFPCSIRYMPGSPENSLIVSERWSGLRESIPLVYSTDEDSLRALEPIHPRDTLDDSDVEVM